jgi:DNA-binding NarL/FixJ family response regulator
MPLAFCSLVYLAAGSVSAHFSFETEVAPVDVRVASPIRVVLVDDSAALRLLVRLAFEEEPDFTIVAEAEDGASGVAAVAAHRPHLVLLDIAMPVMDGLHALTLIREESPGSIVVMLSAFTGSSGAIDRAMTLGAHGYIEKGGGVPELIADLRGVLAREFKVPG